jgi:PAS domain S-box-containing protein
MISTVMPDSHLLSENAALRARLEESEETLRAIRTGELDAMVVDGVSGPQVFILQMSDAASNRFRSDILAKVSDAVVAIDNDRRVIFLNAAAERQYGVSSAKVLGREVGEIFEFRWLRVGDEAAFAAALTTTGHWRGESIHIKRGGKVIHVESSVSRLSGKNGGVSGQLSVIRDITERKQAEKALLRNEALFSTIINQSPGGVYVVDDLFRVYQASLQARSVFAAAEPVIGRDFAEVMRILWGAETGEDLAALFRHTLATGEPYKASRFTEKRLDLDDSRSYDWEIQRIPLPNGKHGVVCYFSDVTSQQVMETKLVARSAALAHADRAKDEFLAMLAHELRNPLAPMRNAAEILSGGTGPEERQQAQRIISRQIENMSRMIDDLLDVSRITEGKIELRKEPVELEPILRAAASLARPGCSALNQNLTVSYPSRPVRLLADATRLEQVLGNLLGNACKYGGEGCRISLSAEVDSSGEAPEVVIRVKDDGVGIDPELLPRIFELFVQASRTLDRAHGGLGIGLTLVQRLVRMHGGSVEARSEGLGRGSEFMVHLPVMEGAVPPPPPPGSRGRPAKPLRILIVDDNLDAAESMAMLQQIRGHETRTAHTGPDAVRMAAEFLPQAVLLDIGLPGMDGYQVARRLRAMPGVESAFLVAMTGYGSEKDRRRAKDAGFDEHLAKPADLELLCRWLRTRV